MYFGFFLLTSLNAFLDDKENFSSIIKMNVYRVWCVYHALQNKFPNRT